MQSPVLLSYPHHIQSPELMRPPTFTPTPTIFPSEDINKTHTAASYSKEPIPELVNSDQGHWAFSLEVPIPDEMAYPILTSLEYTVKYGTENGHGASTIQTSVLLTKIPAASLDAIPNGITTDPPREYNYRAGVGLPQTLDGVPAVYLSSIPAIKENFHGHYIDRQQILPHVRIIEDSRLYLQLDVTETPSALTLRSLVVNVSATWAEDMQGKAMLDKIKAAEMRTRVAEQKKVAEEQARMQAEREAVEARRAKETAEQIELAERKESEDDQRAKQQAVLKAEADRLAKQQADDLAETRRRAEEAAEAITQSYRKAEQDAERRAEAEHQAEVEAEARAQKDRETRSAIERQF